MYECSRVCALSLLHNTQHYTSKKKNNKKQQQLTQANTTWLSVFTVPQDDKTSEILIKCLVVLTHAQKMSLH